MVRCDSDSRNTETRVMAYVGNDIRYETILTRKIESNCWSTAIEVKEKWYKGIVMVVYHSPSVSDADFIRDIVKNLIIKRECIVIGDFMVTSIS